MPISQSASALFNLFDSRQKKHFLILQLVMLFAAILELVGIGSIAPFMAIASDPSMIDSHEILLFIKQQLDIQTYQEFLLWSGGAFLCLLVVSNVIQLVNLFLLNRFSVRMGGELAANLNQRYLTQSIGYFSQRNSAELVNNVMVECDRIAQQFIAPALKLNAKVFSIVLLSVFLIVLDPVVALVAVLTLLMSYRIVLGVTRALVIRNGREIGLINKARLKQLSESYEGIRELKLYHLEAKFTKEFDTKTRQVMRHIANNMIVGQSPYYLMEMVAFGGIISLALFLIQQGGFEQTIPVLALYAMTGYKLIPAFQQSYHSITSMRGASSAVTNVRDVLKSTQIADSISLEANISQVSLPSELIFSNLSFTYPDSDQCIFSGLDARLPLGQVIGIVGPSGAGKSTLIDLLLGLLSPDRGHILLDEQELVGDALLCWQRQLGYVPQNIYIRDASILENIAFGLKTEDVDVDRVRHVINRVCLDDWLAAQPQGLETRLGERGAQMSGGQRQRVAIARALYRNPSVLILDEATSALDSDTEQKVMDTIYELGKSFSVIMITHRYSVLDRARKIYKLNNNQLQMIAANELVSED